MPEDEEFLTIREFASKVHYGERQIRQKCIDGEIVANKSIGRKWLISVAELEKFLGPSGENDYKDQNRLVASKSQVIEKQGYSFIEAAQKEHLSEVHHLIDKFLKNIPISPPLFEDEFAEPFFLSFFGSNEFTLMSIPSDLIDVRAEPLFESLVEHIPNGEFWTFYKNLERRYSEYSKIVLHLSVELGEKGKLWPDITQTSDFSKPAISCLISDYLDPESNYYESDGSLYVHTIAGQSYEILKSSSKNAKRYVKEYQMLCSELLQSGCRGRLMEIRKELWDLQDKVRSQLQKSILSRDYIFHLCKFCPTKQELS